MLLSYYRVSDHAFAPLWKWYPCSFLTLWMHFSTGPPLFYRISSVSSRLNKFSPLLNDTSPSPPPCPPQEVLPDRKRVTTRSYLPITPVDTDSGSNFTCVASNPAVPMGKRATVTLNVHRALLSFQRLELTLC